MNAPGTPSFFTPEQFLCRQERLLAQVYNLAHVLLKRTPSDYLFVPIRRLQYLAIVEQTAFRFVDSLAYATRGNEGGRLITISWHPLLTAQQRDGLNQHVDCRVIFYGKDMSEVQQRLSGEFYQAMQLLDRRYRDSNIPPEGAVILPLHLPTKK